LRSRHHPLLAYCDNTGGEPLAWKMRKGSAGSNTAADHIALTASAIAALPAAFRRRLVITVDGAGASHDLITHLDKLAARPGHQVIYSAGWMLAEREVATDRRARASTLTSTSPSRQPRKKDPGPVEPPATLPASRATVIPQR
jgi:hypothetical protein